VVVSVMDGVPVLLENRGGNGYNWLRVRLSGTKSNRMGVGARVKVTAGGITQVQTVYAGGSYLSSNDPRLHFGVGSARIAEIEVQWPGGDKQHLAGVRTNQQIEIVQSR
jgi:enediyne biosynthesis protein E4